MPARHNIRLIMNRYLKSMLLFNKDKCIPADILPFKSKESPVSALCKIYEVFFIGPVCHSINR